MGDGKVAVHGDPTDWLCVAQWVASHLADLDEATQAGAVNPEESDQLHAVGMRMLPRMLAALEGTGLDLVWAHGVKADQAVRKVLARDG